MKKYLVAFMIITISLFMIGCSKDEGHWILIDTKVNTAEWKEIVREMNSDSERTGKPSDMQTEIEVSENSVFYTTTYIPPIYEDSTEEEISASYSGRDTISGKFTWDQAPHIVPGTKDGFALDVKAETIERPSDFLDNSFSIGLWTMESEKDEGSYNEFSDKDGNTYISSNNSNDFASIESNFQGTLGEGSSEGEQKKVVMDIGFIRITYIYQWEKL